MAQEDELDFLLETLEQTAPPPNMLYGMGVVSGATETNRWESRSRYRISDRLEPGFEQSHPRCMIHRVCHPILKLNHAEQGWNSSDRRSDIFEGFIEIKATLSIFKPSPDPNSLSNFKTTIDITDKTNKAGMWKIPPTY